MSHDTAARSGIVATWAAVVWAEALLILGILLLGIVAAQPSCDFISLGCSGEPSDDGSLVVLLLGAGLVALVASPLVAARLSGWPSAFVAALFAFGAFVAALIVGAVLIGAFANDGCPGVVLGLGVAGIVAVRPPFRQAIPMRVVLVVSLAVLAGVFAATVQHPSPWIFACKLLALPAIGFADTVSEWAVRSGS